MLHVGVGGPSGGLEHINAAKPPLRATGPEDGAAMESSSVDDETELQRQSSAMNLSTPRGRSPELAEYDTASVGSVIRLGGSSSLPAVSKAEYSIKSDYSINSSNPAIKPQSASPRSSSSSAVSAATGSHDAAGLPMMLPPGLQHMQHLIKQHLTPAQFQNFFQQQGLLLHQQHSQLAELNKKQLEEAVRQLQEQLQLLMYQQSQAQHDKSKSAALSLHQSQLMQQLQLLQQRYLLQQAGMSSQPPGAIPGDLFAWDALSERRASPPPAGHHSPPSLGNGPLTNGRRGDDLRNGGAAALARAEEEPMDEQELAAKTSPLYVNGICNWPGCECPCEDRQAFLKHLDTEHVLDDRSAAHARVQVQVVQLIESNLAKEKARLAAMMAHFRMTREKMAELTPSVPEPALAVSQASSRSSAASAPVAAVPAPVSTQASQLLSGHPFLRSAILQGPGGAAPAPPAAATGPVRRRVTDRSMTPGPYEEPPTQPRRRPADRAGQDITEELSRNREFYRTTDIRPPFTYASLIRQGIIESPEKQLTLNEIYSWFQATFAYFRRNAATWKNAVRHNLSLHKCFTRVENVKGAVWTVDEVEFCKRRPQRSAGQARSPTLSSSPTLYGDTLAAGLQSAMVDTSLPFMHTAADRLREMRERDAPTLLGLQRRSPSPGHPPQRRTHSRSPEGLLVIKSEYDAPARSPDQPLHQHDSKPAPPPPPPVSVTVPAGDQSRHLPAPSSPDNDDAQDLSMPAVKLEYGDTAPSVAEAASA